MHYILYILNPQINTPKQKLLREEMKPKKKKKTEELKPLKQIGRAHV